MRKSSIRKVLYALLVVLLWLGFVVDGAHALYVDEARLSENTITTGTASLLISNSQNASSTIFEESRVGFDYDLSPGESADKYFLLKNASQGNVTFALDVSAAITNQPTGNALAAATTIRIQELDQAGAPVGQPMLSTVAQLAQHFKETNVLLVRGETKRFRMTVGVDASFADQGSTLSYDLVFTGNQTFM